MTLLNYWITQITPNQTNWQGQRHLLAGDHNEERLRETLQQTGRAPIGSKRCQERPITQCCFSIIHSSLLRTNIRLTMPLLGQLWTIWNRRRNLEKIGGIYVQVLIMCRNIKLIIRSIKQFSERLLDRGGKSIYRSRFKTTGTVCLGLIIVSSLIRIKDTGTGTAFWRLARKLATLIMKYVK